MVLLRVKPPYKDSQVSADRTQQQITTLLRKYGVTQIRWSTDFSLDSVQLDFVIEYEKNGHVHRIAVRVSPPMFVSMRKEKTWDAVRGRWNYRESEGANWAQSMRLLYYWIKAKIEAVSYGLNSVEKEFLSDIVTTLPDGTQHTIWDMISSQVDDMKLSIEYRGSE